MSEEENKKPRYYDLLYSLLDKISINRSIKEKIINQYVVTPNNFEADWQKMERLLRSMNLRPYDAEYIALLFHSEIYGIPENQLLASRNIPIQTRLMADGTPYPVTTDPRFGVYPPQQVPEKDSFMEEMKEMYREAQKLKIFQKMMEGVDGSSSEQQRREDPMEKWLPMLMMNPNFQVQAKMGVGQDGEQKIQGFTIIPQAGHGGGTDLLSTLVSKMLDKEGTSEQMLLQTLMQNKDNEIERLKQQRDMAYQETSIDKTMEDMKRVIELQRIVNPASVTGTSNPEVAMRIQEIQMKHDLDIQRLNMDSEDQKLRNQLALQEFIDSRKEKMAQMKLSQQALGAVSDNVGKILSDIAAPVAQSMVEGVAEGARIRASNPVSHQQHVPPPKQEQPRLEELSNTQLQEAIRKAKEMKQQSDTVKGQMDSYIIQFQQEIAKRQKNESEGLDSDNIERYSEPEKFVEFANSDIVKGKYGIDLDPDSYTTTE